MDTTPSSSEQNKTPLQLWVQGNFENAERVLQDQSLVGDDYGVDWDGPASSDAYLVCGKCLELLCFAVIGQFYEF